MIAISKRQRARFFIYTKGKKGNVFIYKNLDTSQKARQFPVRFDIQKSRPLLYAIFHEMFEVGIYIKNHDTLCYVTFLYTKRQTLCKKKDN